MAGGAGGGDYAELGIAIQDAIAADARMEGKDGLNAQHRWSRDIMHYRLIGMAIIPAACATPFIWIYAPDVWKGIWTNNSQSIERRSPLKTRRLHEQSRSS